MTLPQLRGSLALWRRRHRWRQRRLDQAHVRRDRRGIEKWERLRREAGARIDLRERQIRARGGKPRIVDLGLRCDNRFGALGPERAVTGHHTAGPKDESLQHAIGLCRSYHGAHAAKGWGGIGYHYCITRGGVLLLLRPTSSKGAHVGGHNSGNVGVMCHGTTGDHPTEAQARTLRWLLANAHTTALPRAHRTDRRLDRLPRRGHRQWPGHGANACPGDHLAMFVSGGARW